jgi:hypothetical protein
VRWPPRSAVRALSLEPKRSQLCATPLSRAPGEDELSRDAEKFKDEDDDDAQIKSMKYPWNCVVFRDGVLETWPDRFSNVSDHASRGYGAYCRTTAIWAMVPLAIVVVACLVAGVAGGSVVEMCVPSSWNSTTVICVRSDGTLGVNGIPDWNLGPDYCK